MIENTITAIQCRYMNRIVPTITFDVEICTMVRLNSLDNLVSFLIRFISQDLQVFSLHQCYPSEQRSAMEFSSIHQEGRLESVVW